MAFAVILIGDILEDSDILRLHRLFPVPFKDVREVKYNPVPYSSPPTIQCQL